jgi:hypothetical protein
MRITLSERKFNDRIRQLENIPAEVTSDEISHRLDHYAAKLFQHLRSYGINQVGLVSMQGTLGHFYVGLDACHNDESRNLRIQGLQMLDPLSVSLEARDLPAFFTGMILTLMADNFDSYAKDFQRITVSELDSKLVDTATKIFAAPMPQPFEIQTENDAALLQEYQEEQFEEFCRRSGVKVPDAHSRAVDQYRRAEEAAVKAAQDKALLEEWNR